jgi:hypothetical protein
VAKTMISGASGNLEETMDFRILSGGAIAAVAGAAMLAVSSSPSPAFTLSAPSLEAPVAAGSVEPVYWRGGWHGGWHRGWGWRGGWRRGWGPGWGWGGPGYYGYYGYGPVWRCSWSPWGFRRCGWV